MNARFITGSILVQVAADIFVHLNVTGAPPGGKPIISASVVGRPPTPEQMGRLVNAVMAQFEGLGAHDFEAGSIIVPELNIPPRLKG